jgi:hypothetical protein
VQAVIAAIPETAWVKWRDAELADQSDRIGLEQPKAGPKGENQGRFS